MIELFDNFYSNNVSNENPCRNNNINTPDKNPDDNTSFDCNSCIIDKIGLAAAYVPYQEKSVLMESDKSLTCGTVFPELVMPYKKRA